MALVNVLSIPGKQAKMADKVAFEMCERFPQMYELVSPPKVTVGILKEHIVTEGLPAKKKEDVVVDDITVTMNTVEKTIPIVTHKTEDMAKHIPKKRKRKRKSKK